MTEKDNQSFIEGASEIEGVLAVADGLPLPPVVKRNLLKSAGRLISSLTDLVSAGIEYPTALIEAKTDQVRATAAARRAVKTGMAKRVPEMIAADPALSERATYFLGHEMVVEQRNRENTIKNAIDDLSSDPPDSDTTEEIDDDWLHAFTKEASTKSTPEMQLYFGKILSGEIKIPGTFSIKAIRTLGMMNKTTANQFQTLCDASVMREKSAKVISLSGTANANSLASFGLSFNALNNLNSDGLISGDFHIKHPLAMLLSGTFDYAGTSVFVNKKDDAKRTQPDRIIHGPTFTDVGMQLRNIVSMRPNALYSKEFIRFLEVLGLDLYKVIGPTKDGRLAGQIWKE